MAQAPDLKRAPAEYRSSLSLLIDGDRLDASCRATEEVLNPATAELVGRLPMRRVTTSITHWTVLCRCS